LTPHGFNPAAIPDQAQKSTPGLAPDFGRAFPFAASSKPDAIPDDKPERNSGLVADRLAQPFPKIRQVCQPPTIIWRQRIFPVDMPALTTYIEGVKQEGTEMTMPMTAEYGSPLFVANKAAVELRAEKYAPKLKAKVRLLKSTAGYEMAGSCARWTDGYYAVRWNRVDGSIHGGRYKTLAEAVAHFDRVTGMAA
jgi:hypothetical protein